MAALIEWVFLVTLSFLPPLIYTVWIRNTERCHRERWVTILVCFLWGASIAIIASIFFEILLNIPLAISMYDEDMVSFLAVVVIAPVVEEFTKPLALGLRSVKKEINELEDGLIYGAVAGLGFSATENLFYGLSFLQQGFLIFLILIIMRSVGGCLLHASASAWTGYGYGKTLLKHTSVVRIVPYFILAILVHSFYNFLVTFDLWGIVGGFFAAFSFVILTIVVVRRKIRRLDAQTC